MMYPTEKYRYYTNGRRVIAVSTYAGKTVRGVATCDPSDEFSMEKGKELTKPVAPQRLIMRRCIITLLILRQELQRPRITSQKS